MSGFDFADLPLHMELKYAAHGDLRPIVKLLRSKKPLPSSIRDYLADELEKPAGKRFRQTRKQDLGTLERRRRLLVMVEFAKSAIAGASLPEHPTAEELEAFFSRLEAVTDREALDYLNPLLDKPIEPNDLANARRAIGPSIRNRPSRKRRRPVS